MDLLRFPLFTIGYAWGSDFCDPAHNPEDFANLFQISPLHNIRVSTNIEQENKFALDASVRAQIILCVNSLLLGSVKTG